MGNGLGSLEPGDYELRPSSTPKGYKAAPGVKFSVTSLEISGGDKEIRTTEGKKIVAGENEVLIAGKFSPDVELTASHEKQIGGVTVKYENFGAALDKKGESKTLEYVTLQAAQEELNHLKNSGEICGAVHISYKLAEKSGRSYTQYLTEKEPDPTPAPPINQGGTANTVTKPAPTAAPTPKVTPTPAPTATPKPTSTPKPTAVPSPTPIPDEQLTIACTSDKTEQAFSFEVSGTRAEGGRFSKDFKTGTDGKIVTVIPAGKYTVTPKNVKGGLEPVTESSAAPQSGRESSSEPILHDFAVLKEKNPDCVGWVSIPDTSIDFPVMQKSDFYLKHDFDGNYTDYGLPFLDERCSLDGSDNLIIYGHHMNDGSMFSELLNYVDEDYCTAHPEIVLETEDGAGTYQIAAVLRVAGSYALGEWSVFDQINIGADAFNTLVDNLDERGAYDTGRELVLYDAEAEHFRGRKKFPNYALMKISAWHKSQRDTVEWRKPLEFFDRVYSSKVFDFTPENPYLPPDTIKGGTGYGLFTELAPEVDGMFPDYSIYPDCEYAIGYLACGCPNRCR